MNELNGRVVKIIGTKYPHLRHLIRNHPYTKIVGIGIIKCLIDELKMDTDEITDELLTEMVEKGIKIYHEKESEINETPVLEQKRKILCNLLKQTSINHLENIA